jgi:hypothetical protein
MKQEELNLRILRFSSELPDGLKFFEDGNGPTFRVQTAYEPVDARGIARDQDGNLRVAVYTGHIQAYLIAEKDGQHHRHAIDFPPDVWAERVDWILREAVTKFQKYLERQ